MPKTTGVSAMIVDKVPSGFEANMSDHSAGAYI